MGLIGKQVLDKFAKENKILLEKLLIRTTNNQSLTVALTELLDRNNTSRSTINYFESDEASFEIELKETGIINVFFYGINGDEHFKKLHRFCVSPFKKNGLDGIKTNDGRCVLIESNANPLNDYKINYNVYVFNPKNFVKGRLKKQREYIKTLDK